MCVFILCACEMVGVYNPAFQSDGITWDGETKSPEMGRERNMVRERWSLNQQTQVSILAVRVAFVTSPSEHQLPPLWKSDHRSSDLPVVLGNRERSQMKGAWHAVGRWSAFSRSSTGGHWVQNGSSQQEPCALAFEPPIRCTMTRSAAPPPTPAPGLSASSWPVSRSSVWPRRSPTEE